MHETLASTNDEAARLRGSGAPARTAVVARAQTAGRGRGGRSFASPEGGLYVSMLLDARPEDLPGPLTAAVALGAARAVEAAAGVPRLRVKWPNDLWIGGRKAAGILLESAGAGEPVVAGVGINVRGVPAGLPYDEVTCLDAEAGVPTDVERLLVALLDEVGACSAALSTPEGRAAVEAEWATRLAFVGAAVRYRFAGVERRGTLVAASLRDGLLLEDPREGRVWRRGEFVQDVRPAADPGEGAPGAGSRPPGC